MTRFHWLKENPVIRELASQLYGKPRRRRPAAAGVRRVLRCPEPLEPRLLLATFLVTNTNNSGAGSLRAAIADANAAAGFDFINFLIAGPGPHVISPQRTNPADPLSVAMPISSPMLINGYSQNGASPNTRIEGNNADIRIWLDGALAGAGAGGLFIDGGSATIQGLAITRFEDGVIIRGGGGGNTIAGNFIGLDPLGNHIDSLGNPLGNRGRGVTIEGSPGNTLGGADPAARNVISANGDIGVRLVHSASVDNIIQGNYIGTNPAGTLDRGNAGPGIEVNQFSTLGFASRTTIGGLDAGAGNVISGNDGSGVVFVGAGAQFNEVLGNRIGTNAAGTAAIANSFSGVVMTFASGNAASNNSIGGVTPGARNIISGNGRAGVAMFGAGATGNAVQGNYIGTNADGTKAIPNGNDGVHLGDLSLGAGPSGNFIGGTLPGAGNLISGNFDNGVEIAGATTSGNRIEGNFIGTDHNGTAAVANEGMGIFVDRAPGTIIGGANSAARNVISGNGFAGVNLSGASATNTTVQGNYIGVQRDGLSPLGNQNSGVLIDSSASVNTIGGTATAAGNVIAFNVADGVTIESGTRNTVRLNSIHANGRLGIDLNANERTLNDADDADAGANNSQNWPEIAKFNLHGPHVTVFFDAAPNTTYTLDFYINDSIIPNLGEGQQHVSTQMIATDADGYERFELTIPVAAPLGRFLTVTATDPDGNTSEFSHDADTDGLYDNWELGSGVDGDGNGTPDFFLNGPDPLHKDLYFEVDSIGVVQAFLPEVKVRAEEFFQQAPAANVLNPDGLPGINLHFEIDPMRVADPGEVEDRWGQFQSIKATEFGTPANRLAKRMTHRYVLFGPPHSLYAGLGQYGQDLLLMARPNNRFYLTQLFVHEGGHTLGLGHGGADNDDGEDTDFKPNYHSVMNGIWANKPFDPGPFQDSWAFNYSDARFPDLDENNLDESLGIGGHPGHVVRVGPLPPHEIDEFGSVDWNQDGDTDDIIVTGLDLNRIDEDVNGDDMVNSLDDTPGEILTGNDDWANLLLNFRHSRHYRQDVGLESATLTSQGLGDQPEPFPLHETIARINDIGYANRAPRVGGLRDQVVNERETVSFTVPATDPEGDALTFVLVPGAPEGLTLDANTGVVSWTTDEHDGPGEYIITVLVTDAGSGRTREGGYGIVVNGIRQASDYNLNGTVDAADYVVWRKSLGQNTTPFAGADGSGNGIIDQADYLVWRANFGKPLLPPASTTGAGAVAALPLREDLDELADTAAAESATPVRASIGHERRENSDSIAIPHFGSPSRNTTTSRGISSPMMRANAFYAAAQDDALLAWLATLATNLATDAEALLDVETNHASANSADVELTTVDLALETMETASI